jgi:hypothetical protein
MARCSASCVASWVGDLINSGTETGPSVAAVDFSKSETPPLKAGQLLYYHVEGPEGVVYHQRVELVSRPVRSGKLLLGYTKTPDGGPAMPTLLSPEARLYCASQMVFPDSIPAPRDFSPPPVPATREEFVRRFGPLPEW